MDIEPWLNLYSSDICLSNAKICDIVMLWGLVHNSIFCVQLECIWHTQQIAQSNRDNDLWRHGSSVGLVIPRVTYGIKYGCNLQWQTVKGSWVNRDFADLVVTGLVRENEALYMRYFTDMGRMCFTLNLETLPLSKRIEGVVFRTMSVSIRSEVYMSNIDLTLVYLYQ